MFSIFLSRSAAKALKRLPENIQQSIKRAMNDVAKEPTRWAVLGDPFRRFQVRSGHVTTAGGQYRFAYRMNRPQEQILVLFIGPRERYYERLRQAMGI